ncbi:MAG: HNH/ENDO VII family nuclease [Bauldia sp.]|nr:HNH/ENDO VII family nuclease [Bauldia sp.]
MANSLKPVPRETDYFADLIPAPRPPKGGASPASGNTGSSSSSSAKARKAASNAGRVSTSPGSASSPPRSVGYDEYDEPRGTTPTTTSSILEEEDDYSDDPATARRLAAARADAALTAKLAKAYAAAANRPAATPRATLFAPGEAPDKDLMRLAKRWDIDAPPSKLGEGPRAMSGGAVPPQVLNDFYADEPFWNSSYEPPPGSRSGAGTVPEPILPQFGDGEADWGPSDVPPIGANPEVSGIDLVKPEFGSPTLAAGRPLDSETRAFFDQLLLPKAAPETASFDVNNFVDMNRLLLTRPEDERQELAASVRAVWAAQSEVERFAQAARLQEDAFFVEWGHERPPLFVTQTVEQNQRLLEAKQAEVDAAMYHLRELAAGRDPFDDVGDHLRYIGEGLRDTPYQVFAGAPRDILDGIDAFADLIDRGAEWIGLPEGLHDEDAPFLPGYRVEAPNNNIAAALRLAAGLGGGFGAELGREAAGWFGRHADQFADVAGDVGAVAPGAGAGHVGNSADEVLNVAAMAENAAQVGSAAPPPTVRVSYTRPSGFRVGVRGQVWANAAAASPDGVVRDPLTGAGMSFDDAWHMGHVPGHEFRRLRFQAAQNSLTRREFLDQHNNPLIYRPELPSSNMSHSTEDHTPLF